MNRVAALATMAVLAACAAGPGGAPRAYVDYQRALTTVCEGKAAKAALSKEFKAKQRALDSRASELDASRAELETKRGAMSDGEREARRAELDQRTTELRSLLKELQKELSDHERSATRSIFDRMSPISREISAELGLALLEGKGQGPGDARDITDELVARYDVRFPVDGCASRSARR